MAIEQSALSDGSSANDVRGIAWLRHRIPPCRAFLRDSLQSLKQHRKLVRADLDASRARVYPCGKHEAPSLEALVDDRESTPSPHQHLHLCPPSINKQEDVT
jgi:hypothetical protein